MELKNLLIFLFAACCGVLYSCSQDISGQADKVIDLRDVEPYSVGISSFTTGIETIKLETSEESMIGFFSSVRIDSVNIYIMDMLYRGIHIFRRSDGKYVSGFRKQGRGHGEYVDISDFFIDHGNNTLEILDGGTQRLLLYDLDTFDYISEIKIPVLAGKFEKSVDEGVYYFDTRHFTNYVNGEKTNSGVIAFDPSDMSCEVLFDYDLPENRSFNIRGFSVNETGEIYYSQMWDNTFYCIRGKKSVPVLSVDPGRKGIPENIAAGSYDMQERFIQERRPGYMSFRLSYYDGKRCIITFADGGKSMFYISDGASELVADKIVADFIDGSPSIDAVNMLILGDMILVVWFPGEEQSEEAAAFLDGMDVMPDDNPVITLFKLK